MKNLFKSVFSKEEKKEARQLHHPRDLDTGDILKFQYLPQSEISNQQFEIESVNTYDFEDRKLTEFALKGDVQSGIFLTVDENDDEAFLSIARKIPRTDVETLFDLDTFSELFDNDEHTILKRLNEPNNLENWTAPQYRQEIFAEGGYFHKGDYRQRAIPESEDSGDEFEYYLAIDDTRSYTIEAEVYDDGETEIIVTIRRPITDIEDMWPSAK